MTSWYPDRIFDQHSEYERHCHDDNYLANTGRINSAGQIDNPKPFISARKHEIYINFHLSEPCIEGKEIEAVVVVVLRVVEITWTDPD